MNRILPRWIMPFVLIAVLSSAPLMGASAASSGCEGLQQARTAALQNQIQRDTNLQQQTVLQEPSSLLDISCMDMIESMLSGINVALFDPTTIYPLLKKVIENLINQACAKAVSTVNNQANQFTQQVSNSTQLPYGLGNAVQMTGTTSGGISTGTRSATNINAPLTIPFP